MLIDDKTMRWIFQQTFCELLIWICHRLCDMTTIRIRKIHYLFEMLMFSDEILRKIKLNDEYSSELENF
jgi:hypothetical protein